MPADCCLILMHAEFVQQLFLFVIHTSRAEQDPNQYPCHVSIICMKNEFRHALKELYANYI